MKANAVRWTPRDDSDLLQHAVTGGTFDEFAERMQCSAASVQQHYTRLLAKMTIEDRAEARRLRDNALKQRLGLSRSVVERLMVEANARRGVAHRDLTAAVFGDPLPGRSALDIRQGSAR